MVAVLNDAQRRAAEADDGRHIVLAAPGTGKTGTLVGRILHLHRERKIPLEAMWITTFTREAAEEIADRLKAELGPAMPPAETLWIGTFHSLSRRVLVQLTKAAGLQRRMQVIDQDQARAILAEVKSLRPAPGIDPLETISRWKEKLVGPGAALREAEGRPDLQPLAQVYAYYQKALSDRGYWDFSDLIVRAVSAFRASPALCEQISRQFRHVLVDEAQDINLAQLELLKGLHRVHGNLWMVADDDQGVYGWRGSDAGFILDAENHFGSVTRHVLDVNYRSTPLVVAASDAVIRKNPNRFPKSVRSARPEDQSKVVIHRAPTAAAEGQACALYASRLHEKHGLPWRDIAVLVRFNAQAEALRDDLMRHGIPVDSDGIPDLWSSRECRGLLAALRMTFSSLNDRIALSLVSSRADLKYDDLLPTVQELRKAQADWPTAAKTIIKLIERLRPLGLPGSRVAEWAANLHQAAQEIYASGSMAKLEAAISDRRRRIEEVKLSGEGVAIRTLHGAKGCEWPAVIIAGCDDGIIPSMQSADMAEERRLFYVGVSRSKGRLILLGAERRAEVMHSPSPYLKDIIEGLPVDRVVVFGPMRDVKLAAVPVQAYKPRQDEPSLAAEM